MVWTVCEAYVTFEPTSKFRVFRVFRVFRDFRVFGDASNIFGDASHKVCPCDTGGSVGALGVDALTTQCRT